jgi:hypothetical protein
MVEFSLKNFLKLKRLRTPSLAGAASSVCLWTRAGASGALALLRSNPENLPETAAAALDALIRSKREQRVEAALRTIARIMHGSMPSLKRLSASLAQRGFKPLIHA